MKTQYYVVDMQTGERVGGLYANSQTARRAVDRLDAKHGGYRYRAMAFSEWESKYLKGEVK